MRSLSFVLAACGLFALASARQIAVKEIEHGFCAADTNQPLQLTELVVEPYPITVHTGAELSLLLTVELLEQVPEGTTIKLDIVKEGLIPLPIPCLPIDGINIGSCEYPANDILAAFADFLCPAHVPDGQACALPLNPGTYGGEPRADIVLPEIPDIIVDLLAAGTYKAEVKANLADGSEMTCIYARIEITN